MVRVILIPRVPSRRRIAEELPGTRLPLVHELRAHAIGQQVVHSLLLIRGIAGHRGFWKAISSLCEKVEGKGVSLC